MRERARQSVHIASLAFALLLRWLTPWQAILFGCGAVAFNLFVLPRIGRALFRAHETPGRVSGGIMVYPLAVLALVTVPGALLGRMDIAAGAWAIMAVGDGAATLVGRAVRGPRLPWNREKTWAGSIALALGGACAAAFFLHWVGGWARWTASPVPLFAAAACAGVCAAWVESLPLPLDDNASVPLVAALVLLACAVASPSTFAEHVTARDAMIGFAGAGALGMIAFAARSVSTGGLIGGVLLGALLWAVSGGWAFGALAAFFVVGSAATRVGGAAKKRAGLSEARGGRRGAAHAWANGLGPLAFAACAAATANGPHVAFAVATAAACATAAADTVATEIGQWLGGPTVSVRAWRRVAPGTPGGIGIPGTIAGLVAAAIVAFVCVALRAVPAHAVPAIVCAAGLGSLLESMLHARLDAAQRTSLVHHALNATNTIAGGLIALAFTWGAV